MKTENNPEKMPLFHQEESEQTEQLANIEAEDVGMDDLGMDDLGMDDIEGNDDTQQDTVFREYPIDSVLVRKDPRTIRDVMHRIEKGRFQLDPDFQRSFVWDLKKQSRLIESCLMRIPLPVFYLAEDTDGKLIVVDGLQRLTTLYRYLHDDFALKLKHNERASSEDGEKPVETHDDDGIDGKRFSELSIKFQERIEDTIIDLNILDAKAPDRAKLDIFDRVNSGVSLTRQQMRNSLYSGQATRWLKKAAESDAFLKATGRALDTKKMTDREAVNRFCAFYLLGVNEFKGDIDDFLSSALTIMNKKRSEAELAELFRVFEQSMLLSYQLFGEHSFRKSLVNKEASRARINISLFDAIAIALTRAEAEYKHLSTAQIKSRIQSLLSDDVFKDSITISTSIVPKVRLRHRFIDALLKLDADIQDEEALLLAKVQSLAISKELKGEIALAELELGKATFGADTEEMQEQCRDQYLRQLVELYQFTPEQLKSGRIMQQLRETHLKLDLSTELEPPLESDNP